MSYINVSVLLMQNIKVMKFNYVERNLKNKHMSVTALRNKSVEN